MTLKEIYDKAKKILREADNMSASFDAMSLFEHCFRMNRQSLLLNGYKCVDNKEMEHYFSLVEKRAQGYPLQYLLGEWCFMDMNFKVGEGVLIPRDDTEVLVSECLERLDNLKNPIILDLCGGSGAVAIGIASRRKDAKVLSLELSDTAFSYMIRNIKLNKIQNVEPIKGDVFSDYTLFEEHYFDAIVSNPPYIPTEDLSQLQKEVQYEPQLALDGGGDGLNFYRAIAEKWTKNLKRGGFLAVEIGINQEEAVAEIFSKNGINRICVKKDIQNINRVVSGVRDS